MPTVGTGHKEAKPMRLVNADEIFKCLMDEAYNHGTSYGFKLGDTITYTPTQVHMIVKKMPTVDIVFCKDCRKHNVSVGYQKDCCPL